MIFGVTEEATIASAGNNRAGSNGEYRKNKHGSGERIRSRRGTKYGGSS